MDIVLEHLSPMGKKTRRVVFFHISFLNVLVAMYRENNGSGKELEGGVGREDREEVGICKNRI